MRYLLLVAICLLIVGVFVGVGVYAPVRPGSVDGVLDDALLEDLPEELPSAPEDVIGSVEVIQVSVDSIGDWQDGGARRVAFVTRLDTGDQYRMSVSPLSFVDDEGAFLLSAGDVVKVEVDFIEDSNGDIPFLYPITIVKE